MKPSALASIALLLAACTTVPASAATVTTIAGTGAKGFSGDGGPATAAQLNNVFGVARGPDGALYLCDSDNHRIRRINAAGIIETYAGCAQRGYTGDGGPATQAALDQPYELAWDRAGHLFFVDIGTHTVRRIDAKTRVITTVAGTGVKGFSGDGGPAAQAQLNQPHSLAFDAAGALYVCDIGNDRIRRLDPATGTITTWAGTGEKRTAPDGSPITGSPLHGPRALAFGPDGTGWLVLREGNALLRLDPKTHTLRRAAGNGQSGFTGSGSPALNTPLSGPKGVALDTADHVYLADTESHSVRYLDVKRGTLEVLIGTGQRGDGPDGPSPLTCQLARPHGIFVDADGALYIGDSENHRIRVWRK